VLDVHVRQPREDAAAAPAPHGFGVSVADYDRLPSRRVPVAGGELFTIDVGEGPTVVLVHGSPVSSLEFRGVIARLRSRFRVVAPDMLSFGHSTGPRGGAGFAEQARALRGLLDALELERFDFVGHDWGGPSGLAAVAERPEQVDRLVLTNTSILADFRPPLFWRPVVAPGIGELALVHANLMGRMLPLTLRAAGRDRELRHRYLSLLATPETRRTMLRLERLDGYEVVCRRIWRALPRMPGSRLLLWGSGDPYFRREYRRLEAAIPGLRRIMVPGGGHFAAEDAPEAMSLHVERFLTRRSAKGAEHRG
jgi:haloalkane dehalogenase